MTSAKTTAPSTSPHRRDGEDYRLSLPNTARSAGIARHFVTSLLTGTPHSGLVEDARLCVTEVVANAHRHTRTSLIRVHVTIGPEQVTVSVADDTPGPRPHPAGPAPAPRRSAGGGCSSWKSSPWRGGRTSADAAPPATRRCGSRSPLTRGSPRSARLSRARTAVQA